MFEETFSSSEFDDNDSFVDMYYSVFTTSFLTSTSLNISSTTLCPFLSISFPKVTVV